MSEPALGDVATRLLFENAPSIRIPLEPGRVITVPPGNTETAVNRSGVRYREILVELKDRPGA